MIDRFYKSLVRLLRSRKFFVFIIILFVVESSWIALSSRYPMAFDEDFHFGLIKIYAHHWSPFLASQPAGGNAFGAVWRDPSYLYHYLMSLPYRLINIWAHSQTAQVIILRFIDIGLFASGLVLFRKLLLKTKAPIALIHTALLFFVLVPVVPLLAGQINYDDLLFPLTALTLLLTVKLVQKIRQSGRLDANLLVWLITVCLLSSLVKYAFLPIFLAVILYVSYVLVRQHKVRKHLSVSAKTMPLIFGVFAVIASSGLFIQRYGVNLVRYHTIVPGCSRVLTVDQCLEYSPWARNYYYESQKAVNGNVGLFTAYWFDGMFERSFFMVNGPESNFDTKPYLPIIAWTAVEIGGVGLFLAMFYWRKLHAKYSYLGFLIAVTLFYAFVLWGDNYLGYRQTGQPIAINGRYLFPVLLPVFLIIGLAYNEWLGRKDRYKAILLSLAFLLFLEGGGVVTFILRSGPAWYWTNNRAVNAANQAVRDVISPIVKK